MDIQDGVAEQLLGELANLPRMALRAAEPPPRCEAPGSTLALGDHPADPSVEQIQEPFQVEGTGALGTLEVGFQEPFGVFVFVALRREVFD